MIARGKEERETDRRNDIRSKLEPLFHVETSKWRNGTGIAAFIDDLWREGERGGREGGREGQREGKSYKCHKRKKHDPITSDYSKHVSLSGGNVWNTDF